MVASSSSFISTRQYRATFWCLNVKRDWHKPSGFENSSEREIGFRRRFLLAFSFTSSSFSIRGPSSISSSISFSFFSSSSSSFVSNRIGRSSTSSLSIVSLFFLSKGRRGGMGESSNSRVGTPGITTCRTKRLHQVVRLTSSPV